VSPYLEEKAFFNSSVPKRDWRQFFFLVFLAFFLFSLLSRTAEKIVLYYRMNQELRTLTLQEEKLHRELDFLRKERQYLEEDWYIEKLAREKLHLVKPGEILVRVIEK